MALSPHELALRAGLKASRLVLGVPVTYTRDGTTITIDRAIQADVEYTPLEGEQEAVVKVVPWLINVAALTLGPPEIGDLITRIYNGSSDVYSVESLGFGVKHWDYSDTGQTQYRIRTRKDGEAAFEVTKPNGFDLAGNEMRYDG